MRCTLRIDGARQGPSALDRKVETGERSGHASSAQASAQESIVRFRTPRPQNADDLRMRLLVVEDNDRLSDLLRKGLGEIGFATDIASTATDAVDLIETERYDVVILDLGLPDEDGLTVLRAMRRRGVRTPVMIVTARGRVSDRVEGLQTGADDYMVKPFALEELTARVQALLRRPPDLLGYALRLGNLTLDTLARQIYVDERGYLLSARELVILECLMRRTDRIVGKELLESNLYGFDDTVHSNVVEVYVHRLRKRLGEIGANVQINTLRGLGYVLREGNA